MKNFVAFSILLASVFVYIGATYIVDKDKVQKELEGIALNPSIIEKNDIEALMEVVVIDDLDESVRSAAVEKTFNGTLQKGHSASSDVAWYVSNELAVENVKPTFLKYARSQNSDKDNKALLERLGKNGQKVMFV